MINAKVIMFSRSLTKDYRWIYSSDFIKETDKDLILNDYKELEKRKEDFLRNKHLVIRYLNSEIAVYKYIETKDKDQNSRKIYALIGCFFSEFEFEIVCSMSKYVIPFLYEEFDVLFEKYQFNIPEKMENVIEKMEFSLDVIVEYFRKKNTLVHLASNSSKFISQHPNQNYIIKNKLTNLVPWEINKNDIRENLQADCSKSIRNQGIVLRENPLLTNMNSENSFSIQKNESRRITDDNTLSSKRIYETNDDEAKKMNENKAININSMYVENGQKNFIVGKNIISENESTTFPKIQCEYGGEKMNNPDVAKKFDDNFGDNNVKQLKDSNENGIKNIFGFIRKDKTKH